MTGMETNLSELLDRPKATPAALRGARRTVLRRRDDEDLVLTTAARSGQDHEVRRPRGTEPATDYNEGDFHGHIAATLLTLTTRTPATAVAACLSHIAPDRMGRLAKGALKTHFPAPLPAPPPSYTDLTASQQQLLQALADLQHAWSSWGIGGRLRDRGLPDSQEALRAYAGLPPGICGSKRT